ncbi:Uncharacterized membrane protein YcaP, DUF421 family [Clostridium amylolyticum]|uniref:Uncharacterized membrane protein YcaP, DUF421 family n=1 Tax=Clostridium amylolyticum TaxID=1121298 RepID=A0A1M6NRJ4_9CLOT|nr:DUF421 domain-containing protein [Clostridium amylolyticum]SHJ98343.1 Uncharacterized membrane protein YcaP, DUF421 family [Clostridium amylolyticum]
MYFFTYTCARALSKKAIAQMTAYEFAGMMILANVAAEPIVDKVVIKSVYGSGLLIFFMFLTSRLALFNKLTPIMEHTPLVLINKGKLEMKNLKYLGLSLNQFMGLLRQQGYDKIDKLDIVIMEPQGNISIFPKAENKPIELKDINIKPLKSDFSIPLIMDGKIIKTNLKHVNKTEEWLKTELVNQGIVDYKREIAMVEMDASSNIIVFRK